ncbi:uncharacterized protein LOC119594220, partial [Penaeus monodon]|uniref:uncharacterized protein LOC119594220 n=1 Tax=Penaeus monodon TaxID=6687 RepID=UPI0018A7DFE1
MLGTIPTFGVFVFMINDFLRFMLKLFVIVFLQVIAFSFAFHMLLRGRASFRNLPCAIMKIVTMMLGDLGYDDLFNNTESPLPYPAGEQHRPRLLPLPHGHRYDQHPDELPAGGSGQGQEADGAHEAVEAAQRRLGDGLQVSSAAEEVHRRLGGGRPAEGGRGGQQTG